MSSESILIEIRAGVGGREAALFAETLRAMYLRYATRRGWTATIISAAPGPEGLRETVLRLRGSDTSSALANEAGVQCIQRRSPTDRRGRIHTSTATVAVLPDGPADDVVLRMQDLRIETMRAKGHGGQGVNRTDSAVRVTHLPTGISASCQDERSQQQNRESALAVLRARVRATSARTQSERKDAQRRIQVRGGERAERMRTYDIPEDLVLDRRLGRKVKGALRVLAGDLDRLLRTS